MNQSASSEQGEAADLPQVEAQPRRLVGKRRARPAAIEGAPPRMGVGHLMLLVAGASFNLGVLQLLSQARFGWTGLAVATLQSTLAGAAWTGGAVLIYRKVKRLPWPTEAGHWLLAICGFQLAVEALLEILNHSSPRPVIVAANVAAITTCVLLVAPTFQRDRAIAWRVLFVLLTLLFSMPYLLRAADSFFGDTLVIAWLDEWLSKWSPMLSLPMIAIAQLVDRRQAKNQTWLHWMGLAVWSAAAVTKTLFVA